MTESYAEIKAALITYIHSPLKDYKDFLKKLIRKFLHLLEKKDVHLLVQFFNLDKLDWKGETCHKQNVTNRKTFDELSFSLFITTKVD